MGKDWKTILKNVKRGFRKTPEWFDFYDLTKIEGNFIDAGYFKGAFSKEFVKRNKGEAFGFEVNPRTVMSESHGGRILLTPLGTSNKIETKELFAERKESPITTADNHFKQTAEAKYKIKMKSIGFATFIPIDLLKHMYGKVGLIKIDTEGMEYETLLGAKEVIEENKPIIIFETHDLNELKKCSDFLETFGYKIKQVSPVDYEAKVIK